MVINMKISSLKILSTSIALLTGFSVVGFAQSAMAQSAVFNFTETISSACQFDALGLGNGFSSTAPLTQNGQNLEGSDSVTVNCNFTGATLQITDVSQSPTAGAATIANVVNLDATADLTGDTTATLTADGSTQSALQTLNAGATAVDLDFVADFASDTASLTAGSYSYEVVMTLTNQ